MSQVWIKSSGQLSRDYFFQYGLSLRLVLLLLMFVINITFYYLCISGKQGFILKNNHKSRDVETIELTLLSQCFRSKISLQTPYDLGSLPWWMIFLSRYNSELFSLGRTEQTSEIFSNHTTVDSLSFNKSLIGRFLVKEKNMATASDAFASRSILVFFSLAFVLHDILAMTRLKWSLYRSSWLLL